MSCLKSALDISPTQKESLVYFSAEVDVDGLQDWKETLAGRKPYKHKKPEERLPKGALVRVNNTDIAVFKYGDSVLATEESCPHMGGPLHLGDIEMLPDRSLCVKCPWHKWRFCISSGTKDHVSKSSNSPNKKTGSCTYPDSMKGKSEARLQVFPVFMCKNRKHIKIGFDPFTKASLTEEQF